MIGSKHERDILSWQLWSQSLKSMCDINEQPATLSDTIDKAAHAVSL